MYCFYCLLKKVWKKVFPDIFFGLLSSETGFGKPDVTMSGWSQMRREGKIWNLSFFLIFIDFIEKELSTKFCGVLIIFHEVMTANVQNISSLFFYILVSILCRMTPWQCFQPFLIIFQKVIKLQNFEILDVVLM